MSPIFSARRKRGPERYLPPGKRYKAICWHGTSIDEGDEAPFELSADYSDYGVVWVTPEKEVAMEFCSWRDKSASRIPLLYEVHVNLQKALYFGPEHLWILQELEDDLSDIREAVPLFEELGYDGWVTQGSVAHKLYADVAVFGDVYPESVSMMREGQWSPFMPLEEAQELLEPEKEEEPEEEAATNWFQRSLADEQAKQTRRNPQ